MCGSNQPSSSNQASSKVIKSHQGHQENEIMKCKAICFATSKCQAIVFTESKI